MTIPFLRDERLYPVASSEDILLAKLRWYRDGGEVSSSQWSDICGIVAANPVMDHQYLRGWAGEFSVTGLLERALREKQ